MAYDPEKHHRRSIRLKGYDYSQPGMYFVTICSWHRQPLFETPELHETLVETWQNLPSRFPTVTVDRFVVMPDHVHGILQLNSSMSYAPRPPLGNIIGAYKSITTVAWLRFNKSRGVQCSGHLWQERFHDHVIRNDHDLEAIREYILNNPLHVDICQGRDIDDKTWEEIISRHIIDLA
jgi:putative transposase